MSYLVGLKNVDEVTGGLQPGDLWGIFGDIGSGKSRLARHIAAQVLQQGGKVAFVDAEMGMKSCFNKITIQCSVKDPALLFVTAMPVNEVWDTLDNYSSSPDLLVLDSVQHLVRTPMSISLDIMCLYKAAVERGIPVLVTIQTNRDEYGNPWVLGVQSVMHTISGSALRITQAEEQDHFLVSHIKCRRCPQAEDQIIRLAR